jgi:hypothetical protein
LVSGNSLHEGLFTQYDRWTMSYNTTRKK